jgi:lipid II:glycine glycyltransferase (peptidoglycan interpeptide bridge formation enzyme)
MTVEHEESAEWDDLVATLGGQPFQAWAWGELKRKYGWQPTRLSSADGRSAAELLIRPFRGLAVGYVPRGPVLRPRDRVDPELIAALVRAARNRRAAFLRLEPAVLEDDEQAPEVDADLRALGFRTAERTLQLRSSIHLDLTPPPDELFKAFSKGHRADVKRAERNGVTVRAADRDEDFEFLHRMLVVTQERKTFAFHSAGYYQTQWRLFGDSARLFIAQHNGRDVAAALVLAWHDYGNYLVAGSTAEALEQRAVHLLQWHAIRWARERGVRTWDLGGMSDARGQYEMAARSGTRTTGELERLRATAERDPLDGVYRFKKGWGGRVVRTVPAYDRVFIGPAYWLWRWRRGEA